MIAVFGVSRRSLLVVSLLVVVLVSSLLACTFVMICSSGALENAVHVKNETELKNAINNTSSKEVIIALDNDITLTEALKIPMNKDITLTSSKTIGYCKIIGAAGKSTITVEDSGVLVLDGIVVTHTNNAGNRAGGVAVSYSGKLVMYSGEISGNTVVTGWFNPHQPGASEDALGGGVYNYGVFEMYGGKISNNCAQGSGGGVLNSGTFKLFGGEISGNAAYGGYVLGGGVFNAYQSFFEMSGGVISGNTAKNGGGGVFNYGSFIMSGGEIIRNSGGVATGGYGTFNRNGGVISGNTDYDVYSGDSNGSLDGGSGSGSGGGSGSGSGSGLSIVGGFSLKDIVVICVGVALVIVGVVVAVLLFTFKKELKIQRKNQTDER
jgi:flagellar basal body-associated protein FliL